MTDTTTQTHLLRDAIDAWGPRAVAKALGVSIPRLRVLETETPTADALATVERLWPEDDGHQDLHPDSAVLAGQAVAYGSRDEVAAAMAVGKATVTRWAGGTSKVPADHVWPLKGYVRARMETVLGVTEANRGRFSLSYLAHQIEEAGFDGEPAKKVGGQDEPGRGSKAPGESFTEAPTPPGLDAEDPWAEERELIRRGEFAHVTLAWNVVADVPGGHEEAIRDIVVWTTNEEAARQFAADVAADWWGHRPHDIDVAVGLYTDEACKCLEAGRHESVMQAPDVKPLGELWVPPTLAEEARAARTPEAKEAVAQERAYIVARLEEIRAKHLKALEDEDAGGAALKKAQLMVLAMSKAIAIAGNRESPGPLFGELGR